MYFGIFTRGSGLGSFMLFLAYIWKISNSMFKAKGSILHPFVSTAPPPPLPRLWCCVYPEPGAYSPSPSTPLDRDQLSVCECECVQGEPQFSLNASNLIGR